MSCCPLWVPERGPVLSNESARSSVCTTTGRQCTFDNEMRFGVYCCSLQIVNILMIGTCTVNDFPRLTTQIPEVK